MTQPFTLDPSTADDKTGEERFLKVCAALGYDPESLFDEGRAPRSIISPFMQIEKVMGLLQAEGLEFYRKGWQRIVDNSTPAVPDLIFGTQMEVADLGAPTELRPQA